VVASGTLTILLGNHDVELSSRACAGASLSQWRLPVARELPLRRRGVRAGELLVEHGNRYEGWNVVAHDSLRRLRSALSRGEPAPTFRPSPAVVWSPR